MSPNQIFLGYDAVDNSYFRMASLKVRLNPTTFAHLSRLDSECPVFLASFRFIKRKNLRGLLSAYAVYRQTVTALSAWRLIILGDGEERDNLCQLACCYHAWLSLKVQANALGKTMYRVRTDLFSDYLRAQLYSLTIKAFMPT